MDHDTDEPPHAPAWLHEVEPGRMDRRILDQSAFWVTVAGHALRPSQMSTAHLTNVLTMLQRSALRLHLDAMLDALEACVAADLGGEPAADSLIFELTGHSIADLIPEAWLASTELVRGLRRELRRRDDT